MTLLKAAEMKKGNAVSNDEGRMKRVSWWVKQADIFAFSPKYEVASYRTWLGAFLSCMSTWFLVFYIGVTLRDYIIRPPDLIKQGSLALPTAIDELALHPPDVGVNVVYILSNGTRMRIEDNDVDPYFRVKFTHRTIRE